MVLSEAVPLVKVGKEILDSSPLVAEMALGAAILLTRQEETTQIRQPVTTQTRQVTA
jgi:hypothetical protein